MTNNLLHSYSLASTYPKNLISPCNYEHELQSYVDKLDELEFELFEAESKAELDFWDLEHGATEFSAECVRSPLELHRRLRVPPFQPRRDPRCRYVFIQARHQRARLRVTRQMLLNYASYHQIMPSFLDFVFSFGHQHHAKDFFFAGFRHENRLSSANRGEQMPALGRTGRSLELCYGLRSVEAVPEQETWPWSVEAIAVQHAFDLESGQTQWLIVKGSRSMKDQIMAETKSENGNILSAFSSRDQAFLSALATHQFLCNWAGQNWRWYVDYMEQQVQDITRKTLVVDMTKSRPTPTPKSRYTRTDTGILVAPKRRSGAMAANGPRKSYKGSVALTNLPVAPGPDSPPLRFPNETAEDPFGTDPLISFEDLQTIEYIEEHANGALLVISLDSSVLRSIEMHYKTILESQDCPYDIRTKCRSGLAHFMDRLGDVLVEMQIQKARVETLLRLLADRKALLYLILENRNVAASKDLAEKAQISSDHVEFMTQQMKEEAVFMRIITLVTLVFLPGTFISTLMSTDIVQWQTGQANRLEKIVSTGAIVLFVATTVPLMLLTFGGAIVFYRWKKWQERKKIAMHIAEKRHP